MINTKEDSVKQQSEDTLHIEVIESKVDLTKSEIKGLREIDNQISSVLTDAVVKRNKLDAEIERLKTVMSGIRKIFNTK